MTETRLRRGLWCRLASSNTQTALSVVCLLVLFALGYSLFSAGGLAGAGALFWIWTVAFFVPWLAGVSAWARADTDGLRWRYWMKQDFPWERITRITLTKRELNATPLGATRTATIVVHGRTVAKSGKQSTIEVNIRPAEGAGRNLRRFATELSALARQHGVQVVVEASGWDEPMAAGAEEKSSIRESRS
ncbi:MAG TPA: hypothetical protein VFH38_05060 [Jatrophihabitans sp.]|nr:hypothetical protein [Jatrophihabitans sp.]